MNKAGEERLCHVKKFVFHPKGNGIPIYIGCRRLLWFQCKERYKVVQDERQEGLRNLW